MNIFKRCNVSVHQKCYSLEIVPQDDWICELCLYYGPQGRHLRCPLCSRRGGAMKPTNLLMKESFLEQLNPSYHQYTLAHQLEEQEPINDQDLNSTGQERLFYDFQLIQNLNQETIAITEELPSKYMWAHLTCAFWLPECFFTADNKITGLPNVEKKRFNLTCHICKIKKSGACIQCSRGKCCTAFHPECARRAQFFMESKEQPEGYMIYCEKHMPLKLKRIIENRTKNHIEEIHSFCKQIEKNHQYFMTYTRIPSAKKTINHRTQQIEIELEIKTENHNLLEQLKSFIIQTRLNKISIVLNKVDDNQYVVQQIQEPMIESEIMNIPPTDSIWSQFKFLDFTPEQTYRLYKRAVRMNKPIRKIKHKQFIDFFDQKRPSEKKSIKPAKLNVAIVLQQKKQEPQELKFRIPKYLIGMRTPSDLKNNNFVKKFKFDQLLDYDQQLNKRRSPKKKYSKANFIHHHIEREQMLKVDQQQESASFEMNSLFDVDKISLKKKIKRL